MHFGYAEEVWAHIRHVYMNPIPKSPDKDLTNLQSWRAISVGSSEALILEKLIANQLKDKFTTSNNQFAYKKGYGCETPIKLLRTLDSECRLFWVLFLDASAAFDKISHSQIQCALHKANFKTSEVNRIMCMLQNNIYHVTWLQLIGNPFTQKNGLKQGGGLSGQIFALCYEDIISICQNKGPSVGLLHHAKISKLVYADDIVLVSFSIHGSRFSL